MWILLLAILTFSLKRVHEIAIRSLHLHWERSKAFPRLSGGEGVFFVVIGVILVFFTESASAVCERMSLKKVLLISLLWHVECGKIMYSLSLDSIESVMSVSIASGGL